MSKLDFPLKFALNVFVCSYVDPPGYVGEKPSLKKKVFKSAEEAWNAVSTQSKLLFSAEALNCVYRRSALRAVVSTTGRTVATKPLPAPRDE